MKPIWTSPSGNYQLRELPGGLWAWFVKAIGGDGWQQLYGTYPPASVVEEFARQLWRADRRAVAA